MILALDTSTPTCRISIYSEGEWHGYEWESGRTLAKNLLGYIKDVTNQHGTTMADLSGLVAFQGPGSYTGLRIGLTVLNTIANAEHIPIVGVMDEDWKEVGLRRLTNSEDDQLVMPEYGGEPHITTPRK